MSKVFSGRDIEVAAIRRMGDPLDLGLKMGQARQMVQMERVEAVKAAATPPVSVGPEIPAAPARGPFVVFTQREFIPGGSGGVSRPSGYKGRQSVRAADVFDRMEERARKAHLKAGTDEAAFEPPLTPAQVQVGRDYRDMVERHSAGGVKCSSLEAQTGGGQGGGAMDAHIDLGCRIAAMRARAAKGGAMAMRIVRPSASGSRRAIFNLVLVDMVCLRDMELGQVLDSHGWATRACVRESLRKALAAALDRMQGYDLARPQDGA